MAFISVTRLRIRSIRFLPAFAWHAVRSTRQARIAPGFCGGALLPDRNWTFWTMTAWDTGESMRRYMRNGQHQKAMPYLVNWCDEASVVHWTQDDATLPSWNDADRRMRSEGRASRVRRPSPDHAALAYATPRVFAGAPITPKPTRH